MLAHRKCNNSRGSALPTTEQVLRAKALIRKSRMFKYREVRRIAPGFWEFYAGKMTGPPLDVTFSKWFTI